MSQYRASESEVLSHQTDTIEQDYFKQSENELKNQLANKPIGVIPGQHDSGFHENFERDDVPMDQSHPLVNKPQLIIPPRVDSPLYEEVERDRVMTVDYMREVSSDSDSPKPDSIQKRFSGLKVTTTQPSSSSSSRPIPRKPRSNPSISNPSRKTPLSSSISTISNSATLTTSAPRPSLLPSAAPFYSSNQSVAPPTNYSSTAFQQSAQREPHFNQLPSMFGSAQPLIRPSVDSRFMLQQYLSFLLPDKEGDTGLHLAVIHSHSDLLDRLLYIISNEASLQPLVDEQNNLYQTPLHLAVHTQQTDMINKLLLSGASLNVTDHKGNTALHITAQFSSTKCLEELALYVPLQTLLEVAPIRNNAGQTCVHIAAQHGNTDILRKMKSLGLDIDMQDLKSGKTALHVMVEKGSLRDIQFLLETCHADVNATTFTSCTPLHIASGRGDISCVAYLLSQGASPDIMTDEGDTALDIAGSDEVFALLTKAAALKWCY